jgi:hypothetical protein
MAAAAAVLSLIFLVGNYTSRVEANSARGYQSTSYLICMDIRYELGPFQNPPKNVIWPYMGLHP